MTSILWRPAGASPLSNTPARWRTATASAAGLGGVHNELCPFGF